ncbi:hypothetical protein Tco_0211062 [Tanacetum coccineum]
MTESPLVDSGFVVPVFSPRDDPIACLNKAIAFLTVVASSRFPSTNNQLRTFSNPRNHATIQDGRVTVQQVQGDKVKVILVLGIRVMLLALGETMQADRQGLLNATTVNVKDIWLGNALSQSDQGMHHDPRVPDGQVIQKIIPNNAAFQTEDLDTYDFDCDDISNAQAVLIANISNYGSDVISEVSHSETNLNDMENQSVLAMQEFEQSLVVDSIDNEILFKSESKEKEDKYIENEIDLEKKIKELDNIIYKVGQSDQTVYMLTKPQAFYDNIHKQALGYQNPFHLKKAQWIKPTLYDGIVMSDKHVAMLVIHDEKTLILEEESRSKQRIQRKCLTPQQEMDAEQVFWLRIEDLLNEIMEVETVFNQMDVVVQQFLVDKQCLKIAKKELLLEND